MVNNIADVAATGKKIIDEVERAVVGKRKLLEMIMASMLAGGHVLLEDNPGLGKTLVARSFAAVLGLDFKRIQFTPDLLPGDITGGYILDRAKNNFQLRQGPIFANIVLADEINRASPKTQAALLEVMEEGQVTVDGQRHEVGKPFMVIATMNPIEQAGTYALPEAQLDRFLIKTSLNYPDHQTTVELLADSSNRDRSTGVSPLITAGAVAQMAELADDVHVDPSVLDYVARIAEATRAAPEAALGASVRGCLALVRTAKTWAASNGRTYVKPDDIKSLVLPVFGHRVLLTPDAQFNDVTAEQVLGRVLADIAPPEQRGAA